MSNELKAPTPKQYSAWFEQFPYRENPAVVCALCGTLGKMANIQPVHPYWQATVPEYVAAKDSPFIDGRFGMCVCCHGECADRVRAAREARRKEVLAQMERCEVHASRRATYTLAGHALCGRCKTAVLAKVNKHVAQSGLAGLAMFGDIGQGKMVAHEIERMVGQ